jgi:hypothetical protein
MFDGIRPNPRMLRSMFEHVRIIAPHAAPELKMPSNKWKSLLHLLCGKIVFSYEVHLNVEIASNIQDKFFALNVRRNSPQPSVFVR